MGILSVMKIVQVFNILIIFLFQSLYLQIIHLLFIAAGAGPGSRKIFIPAYELGRIVHSAATREQQFFFSVMKNQHQYHAGKKKQSYSFFSWSLAVDGIFALGFFPANISNSLWK